MINRTEKLQARFYETASGRKPARESLLEIDEEDRRIDGLWKIRGDLTDGKIGRIIFCIIGGEMVLLHGFIKKTQKTPLHDIELARKRRKERQ